MSKSMQDYRREVLDILAADSSTVPSPGSPAFEIVTDMLSACLNPRYVPGMAGAIWDRNSMGVDDFGFRYPVPEVLDWDEQPWEGTQVLSILGECYLPEPVFERLMCRVIRLFLERLPLQGEEAAQVEEKLRKIEARSVLTVNPQS
jgi:hypothetical protein